ncbi:hypothetical protein PVAND_013015 [Polypedilum vanderplanki]|uniref:RecQ-like DNA helicase BLM n=1 Tax=Polypedilum vanderplanki TaxID=319348 RepID=A0A9J6CQ68_POLVA|nr:hypothetical protein PVAND_013015 [Polypedilum vanderplanki]
MSKNGSEKGKQMRLDNFFSKNNSNNNKPENQSKLSIKKRIKSFNLSDDDSIETPTKILNGFNCSEIKENLDNLSRTMNESTPTPGSASKFKFKTSSNKDPPSSSTSNTIQSLDLNSEPKKSVFGKQSQFFINDDSLEDILPLKKPTQKTENIIKPEPLFRIKGKITESSQKTFLNEDKNSLFKSNQIQLLTKPPIEKILLNEREVNMTFAKSETAASNQPKSTKDQFEFLNSDIDSSPHPVVDLTAKHLSPTKFKTSTISDQLASMIHSKKTDEFDSPLSSFYHKESLSPNLSTPSSSQQDTKVKIKVDNQEIASMIGEYSSKNLEGASVERLKEEKLKFQDVWFNYFNQIPFTVFESIEGFDKTTVIRLKGVIQSLNAKIRKQSAKSSQPSTPHQQKPQQLAKPSTNSINFSFSDDDEQFGLNEIINNIEEEEKKMSGKFDNNFIDLSVSPAMKSSFKPRVNMKDQTTNPTTSRTQLSNVFGHHSEVNAEADNDGFPIFDYSSLEDVVPIDSTPIPSSSNSSLKENKRPVKQTIDSMIPDNPDEIQFKNTSSVGVFYNNVTNDGISGEFDGMNYPFSKELQRVFENIFGLRKFRQNQLQAINAALLGHDCFVLMPTGGGKSLCYQLPALLSRGVTIVISPLKSLILDQVNKLNSLDIRAAALSGEVSQAEAREIFSDINKNNPTIKLLYVTPEKISASTFFQDTLTSMHQKGTLARFVVDEAHCVSTWGHDFRPDYKKLGELKNRFSNVPVMALTATANIRVRADVIHQLKIAKCKWFLSSFNRPNLKYIVTQKTGAKSLTDIINLIKTKFIRASGIIYCLSRKDCDTTAEKLQLSNIRAISYHAGLTDKVREKVQNDWLTDKYRVVCATIAFGMGIDKPDVRYVIHYSMPKSIEGYYQESGRAGRDGALATCILYYNYSDRARLVNMILKDQQSHKTRQVSMENINLVVNFCENMIDCRRITQLNYFGEHFTREQCLANRASACDNCSRISEYKNIDATEIARTIISSVQELCERSRFTLLHMIDVFKGAETKKVVDSGHKNTRYHGHLKQWDRTDIQRIFHKLVIENYLREDITVINDIPIAYLKLGEKVADIMRGNKKIEFAVQERQLFANRKKNENIPAKTSDILTDDPLMEELQDQCYHELMEVAKLIADERNLAIQQVMNMEALRQMSIKIPKTVEEMLEIPHVTKANFNKYGQGFLNVCQSYRIKRTDYEMARQLQREEDRMNESYEDTDNEEDDDNVDWDALGRQATTSSAKVSGYKRKGSFRASNIAKRYKRSFSKKTPTKKKTSATKTKGAKSKTGKSLLPPPRISF